MPKPAWVPRWDRRPWTTQRGYTHKQQIWLQTETDPAFYRAKNWWPWNERFRQFQLTLQ